MKTLSIEVIDIKLGILTTHQVLDFNVICLAFLQYSTIKESDLLFHSVSGPTGLSFPTALNKHQCVDRKKTIKIINRNTLCICSRRVST